MSKSILFVLFSCFAVALFAAEDREPDPLFQSSELLEISLAAPFYIIDRDRDKEQEYEGIVSYTDAAGQSVVLDVTLEVRGNDRLRKSNCSYSQLWVDFKRSQTAGTVFENQNRLKLVVQCGRSRRYTNYLVKEYQAYQLFANFSNYNLDTRLLNVSFVDGESARKTRTHFAFFIEHQQRLAERFQLDEVELNRIPARQLEPKQTILLSLFMYLIGNTDYAVLKGSGNEECCHNTKPLKNTDQQYILVPYDFDSSGYVNTNYASPPEPALGITKNTTRLYRGFCVPAATFDEAISVIQASRERINSIIGDTTYVDARTARRSLGFVEEFFETIDDPEKIQRRILRNCRG